MPIFCVKSVKNYTGQKKFTRVYPWDPWQIWGMQVVCKVLTNFKSAPKVIYGSGFEMRNYFESAPLPGVQSTILFCEVFILCFHMARRWIGHMLLKTPPIRGYMQVGYHMSVPCESQVVILYNWRVNINWQLTFNIGLHLPITKFLTGPTLQLARFEDTWTTISIYLRLPSFESISNSDQTANLTHETESLIFIAWKYLLAFNVKVSSEQIVEYNKIYLRNIVIQWQKNVI